MKKPTPVATPSHAVTLCNAKLSPNAKKRADFFNCIAEVQRASQVMIEARRIKLGWSIAASRNEVAR